MHDFVTCLFGVQNVVFFLGEFRRSDIFESLPLLAWPLTRLPLRHRLLPRAWKLLLRTENQVYLVNDAGQLWRFDLGPLRSESQSPSYAVTLPYDSHYIVNGVGFNTERRVKAMEPGEMLTVRDSLDRAYSASRAQLRRESLSNALSCTVASWLIGR